MTSRWGRSWGGTDWCPRWTLRTWHGWGSWLFGVELLDDFRDREWTLWLRLGPVAVSLGFVR